MKYSGHLPAKLRSKLERLRQGELAAVDSYRHALEAVEQEEEAYAILEIQSEHQRTVNFLSRQIERCGGSYDADRGFWLDLAGRIEQTATSLGTRPALLVLREGERLGLLGYRRMLHDSSVPTDLRESMSIGPLLRQYSHIAKLDRLIKNAY